MISVSVNTDEFEYDIHSLFKAFYPGEDVKLSNGDDGAQFKITLGNVWFSLEHSLTGVFLCEEVLPGAERTVRKNAVKSLIYKALVKITGQELVWGSLTGIRPTKIARNLLEEGKSDGEVLDYMQRNYFVSDEKANLSIDIAKRELEILRPLHIQNGYSLYIGIPFCPTTCLYCSFTSNPIAKWRGQVNEYLAALKKEIDYVAASRNSKILDTIYIGGGTPTTLEAGELDDLLGYIERKLDLSKLLEFTVEAGRPDSITVEKLKVLKAHGVTRISVNPQTMNQKTLDFIGRRHTVSDVIRSFNTARDEGFDNINMDIILGLPGEGEAEVSHTIDEIRKLSPDSLTVHSLAVKRGSALHENIRLNGYETMINTPETMRIAAEGAASLSMKPYYLYRQKNMAGNFENTGYARAGCYGIYNILIMEELESIVALGPGSVSKVLTRNKTLERCDNVKDIRLYIDSIDEMINRKKELFSLE